MTAGPGRYEVAIVGAGPVGLALGVELGQRGVRCVVIERRTRPHQIPKGQNLTQRTMESFYSWGCAAELRAARILPPGFPIANITAYQNLMSDYWFAPPGREVVRDYYFQENERLPQYLTERVLARRLAELPSVEVRSGRTAQSVRFDDEGALIELANPDSPGAGEEVAARYVVGCDGARSFVRESAQIARRGSDFGQPMLLAVFRSRGLAAAVSRFPAATTYRVLNPALRGYWQFFGRVDASEHWFFHAPAGLAAGDRAGDARAQILASAGTPLDIEFEHVGIWDLRVEVAGSYQSGSVFIAGDAAHTHPPYGGFGLNTGLEDVRNLGWKLEAVLRGWGGERLLASYSGERQPVFAQTGEQVIAGGIARDREFLERHRPDGDATQFAAAWRDFAAREPTPSRYEPHYEGSPVVAGGRATSPGVWGRHSFEARPGHHLSPHPLSSGQNVYRELGPHFTLLSLGHPQPEADAFAAQAGKLGVPLRVVRDDAAPARDFYAAPLVLVRPDNFVAWTGDDATAAEEALTQATGR
jgi:2-polyprenyl-6-methoxyphenol hydroxylase-like FAD-dependent oxidoreductase